ncbi:dTDP-4-dehydrorhamnose reductase [Halomonas elongata]|uniref:dTDP-4-dehydrorhamnose reductase n=1 Tax=Halomonas elongata TaxID=2746 RepID=UPI0033483C9D
MNRVLVLGGNGQIGFELQRTLAPLAEVLAPGREALDLEDAVAVVDYLGDHQPDIIVNAAAWTDVDGAEVLENQQTVSRLNEELPAQLANYATRSGIPLVHYSSDYVYDAKGNAPLDEDAPTSPCNRYGESKLAGDRAILASSAKHLVLRTSWVYGVRGRNFMNTMLRLGRERSELRVVDDQIGAPTTVRLIGEVTLLALQALRQGHMASGLYHLTSRGETSWHGFACEIFRQTLAKDGVLEIVPERVAPISASDYSTLAVRPLNSRLAVSRIERALGIRMPDWRSQLALVLDERLEYCR